MTRTTLTPHESLLLISKTIQEVKNRFKESGHIYIMFGILLLITSLSQFILIQLKYYQINYYPYFLMPLAGIYTYFYYRNKYKKQELHMSVIGKILKTLGIVLGINFTLLGFIFSRELGSALFPIFFIFLALWIIITGISINFKPFVISGIIINAIGLFAFFIDSQFHPILMSGVSIVGLLIPGLILNKKHTEKNV